MQCSGCNRVWPQESFNILLKDKIHGDHFWPTYEGHIYPSCVGGTFVERKNMCKLSQGSLKRSLNTFRGMQHFIVLNTSMVCNATKTHVCVYKCSPWVCLSAILDGKD